MAKPDSQNRSDCRISVVINNYNYADYLEEALNSALSQLSEYDEIVVVDDGSTDGSHRIIEAYAQRPQIEVILQRNERQLTAVFNGLERATGDLCVLLDSDDYLLPGYLDRLRNLAGEHPEIDLFFSDAEVGGQSTEGKRSTQRVLDAMALPPGPTGLTRWGTWAAGEFVGTPTSGLALRRSLADRFLAIRDQLPDYMPVGSRLSRILGIPSGSHAGFRLSADGILLRGSSIIGARKFHCTTPAFHYRVHGKNAFAGLGRMARLYLRMLRSRQIVMLTSRAMGLERRPYVSEVLQEASSRSRPIHFRRRLRLTLNYQYAVLRAQDPLWRRMIALPKIAASLLPPPDTK
jgi:glycosyltransferase involved in cell wall biosynthesis